MAALAELDPLKSLGRNPGVLLTVQIATTGLVAVFAYPTHLKWRIIIEGFVYASCAGWLAWFALPCVAIRVRRLAPAGRFAWLIVASAFVGVAGFTIGLSVLSTFGFISRLFTWQELAISLAQVVVLSLVIGFLWTLYTTLKSRLRWAEAEARLTTLESRLRPHFLFNTLNSIAALIGEDPGAAETMTVRLAALLRSSLDTTHRRTIRLEEELKLTTDYMDIEKVRFGDRTNYAVDIPSNLLAMSVPPFCLQTLVSNCVKYGGSHISIAARQENAKLLLSVSDSGAGFEREKIRPGHGLANLQAQLSALWGSQAALDILPRAGGVSVRLSMPASIGK